MVDARQLLLMAVCSAGCGVAATVDGDGVCPPRPEGCPSCWEVYLGTDGAHPAQICYMNPGLPEHCQPFGNVEACGRAACWGAADCGVGNTFEAPRTAACSACLEQHCFREIEMCEAAP